MRKSFLIVTGLFLITCNNTMKATANTVTTTPPISIASGSAILNSENNFNIDNLKDFVSEHFNIDEKTGKESILETKGKRLKAYTTKKMYVKANVHIRKKPTKKSKSFTILPLGKKITVVNGKKKKWTKIEYKGKFAYVNSKYVCSKKPKIIKVKSVKLIGLSQVQKNRAYTIANICIKEWKRYGVLPSTAISQAMVESTLGKHCRGYNLWGIKSGSVRYSSLENGVYAYLRVINNGCYGTAPFTKNSSSQIRKILSGGYCVPVGNYYKNATWIVNKYKLKKFDKMI